VSAVFHLSAAVPANAISVTAPTSIAVWMFQIDGAVSPPDSTPSACCRKNLSTRDFDSDGVRDQLHSTRAAVVVGGAHHSVQKMEPPTMAALAILVGIGFFGWLLYGAAIYTLPFLVGASVGLRAEQAGASPLGGIMLGIGAGALVLVVGRAVFARARGPVLRVAIASVFAGPAALAGYSATSTLFGLGSASEGWRQAFAILGAIAIGAIAWQRLAATLPPAGDDNQRRPPQVWGQGARHRAGNPRRRPRSV
jgi:MFS family permease